MTSTIETDQPHRALISFRLENIPGKPLARSLTIANLFTTQFFQREFSWDMDYVYTPADIEATSGKRYLILDINKNKGDPRNSICYRLEASCEDLYVHWFNHMFLCVEV